MNRNTPHPAYEDGWHDAGAGMWYGDRVGPLPPRPIPRAGPYRFPDLCAHLRVYLIRRETCRAHRLFPRPLILYLQHQMNIQWHDTVAAHNATL